MDTVLALILTIFSSLLKFDRKKYSNFFGFKNNNATVNQYTHKIILKKIQVESHWLSKFHFISSDFKGQSQKKIYSPVQYEKIIIFIFFMLSYNVRFDEWRFCFFAFMKWIFVSLKIYPKINWKFYSRKFKVIIFLVFKLNIQFINEIGNVSFIFINSIHLIALQNSRQISSRQRKVVMKSSLNIL